LDRDLLEGEEEARITQAILDLKTALGQGPSGGDAAAKKPATLQLCIDGLDEATKAWAGRRMNRAIASALSGQVIDSVAQEVDHARGVDAHVLEHEKNRASRH